MKHSNDKLFGVPAVMLCSIVGCFKGGKYGSEETNYKPNPSGSPDGRAADVWGAIKEAEMKRLTLVLMAALLPASTAAHAGWERTYGSSGRDEGRCVQHTSDGGYIATGYREHNSMDRLWIIKTDSSGNIQWQYIDEDTSISRSMGHFVVEVQDENYVVTGFFRKTSELETWLLKVDSNGDTLWTKSLGPGAGHCVRENQDGSLILVGGITGFPQRLMLLKADQEGDSLWKRIYILNDWVYFWGYYVDELVDGGFILTGLVGDTAQEAQKEALWLIRTDSIGDTLWTRTYGGENWGDSDIGRCVREIESQRYIVLGNFGLFEADSLGDSLWFRNYMDRSCVQQTYDKGYILSGEANLLLSSYICNPGNVLLTRTDSEGNSSWIRDYGSGNLLYVQETSDSGFVATGSKNMDLYLIKTDSLGLLGIAENPIVEADNGWNVPHSIGSYIVLHYQGLPQGFRANVFDVSGRQVDQIRGDGNEGGLTWGINQPPGVYFIQAMDNQNRQKTAKVVLVR